MSNNDAAKPMEPSDEWLMVRFAQGDDECFMPLYNRYKGRVYGYLRGRVQDPSAAEEIFQEAFLRVVRSRASYKSDGHFAPWLFAIVRNCMVDYLRQQTVQQESVFSEILADSVETSHASTEDQRERVASIVSALNARDKLVLSLRYVEDLSFAEVASRIGLTVATARKIASRAVKKLRSNQDEKND